MGFPGLKRKGNANKKKKVLRNLIVFSNIVAAACCWGCSKNV
jgi:hypothetical protein